MGIILRRALLPTLLAIGGVAMLLYGAIFHLTPVLEERESKITIDIPSPFQMEGPPPFPGGPPQGDQGEKGEPMAGPPQFPGGLPFGGPPPTIKKTVTRIDRTTIMEREPTMTREVTIGGVVLLATGEIKRTYDSKSGKGPALCPT